MQYFNTSLALHNYTIEFKTQLMIFIFFKYTCYLHLYNLEEGSYGVIDHIGHSKDIDKSYNKLLKHINDSGMDILEDCK